jgi:hypothetical protein
MKRLFGLIALSLFVVSVAAPVLAWELTLTGEGIWRYRYISRTGNNDIFGPVGGWPNLGVNHLITYPSPNNNNPYITPTFGVVAGEPGYGPDMNVTDYTVNFYPRITVNPAIQMRAQINLTSLGIHSAGQPYDLAAGVAGDNNTLWTMISDAPASIAVPNTFVTVPWLSISLKTPALDLALGYRPTLRGIGLAHNPCSRSSSALTITTTYGPFVISYSPYLGRTNSRWGNVGERNQANNNNPWRRDDDRDYLRGYSWAMSYSSGPLYFVINSDGHTTNAYQRSSGSYVPRSTATFLPQMYTTAFSDPYPDQWVWDNTVALKYFNGRFFFNAEASHWGQWQSGRGASAVIGATRLEALDADQNAWVYGVEFGTLTGPMKLTLSYFRATGDDPNTRKTDEEAARGDQGLSSCYVNDWAYLMYYTYGTGTSWDAEGKGQPSNLHHLGARVDYAVASNLNIFGVYSYAWRDQPNAFQLGGDWFASAQRFSNTTAWTLQTAGFAQTAANHSSVPDHARSIGWEINAGFSWKLLENLRWDFLFAYWKLGNWWAFAYPNTAMVYRGSPRAGTAAAPVALASISPLGATAPGPYADLGRDIDPLIALEASLKVDF